MDDDRPALPEIIADLRRAVLESRLDAMSKLRAMVAIDRFQLDMQQMLRFDIEPPPPRHQMLH